MVNIITDTYEIFEGQGKLKIVTNDWYLASRLQEVTKYYPEGTAFTNGEEPVFHFSMDKLTKVVDVLSSNSNQRSALLSTIKQQRALFDQRKD
jgi:hypothetical protein